MRINSAQSGMTLIQMAGILLIISIMMVPFFQIQSLSKKHKVLTQSRGQVSDVAQALVKFALENGRYPLPANPELPLSDPVAGDEATEMWADEDERDDGVREGPNNACGLYGTSPPNNLMVCVEGVTATSSASAPFGQGAAGNRVIIGTIPFTALGLTPAQSLDEFGNKMTYAVTYGLTKAATFSNDKGNIQIKDQNNTAATAGCELTMDGSNPSTKTHFVVISHGPNKLGAFPVAGGGRTCTGTSVKGEYERDNCNNDANFRLLSTRKDDEACTANKSFASFTQRMPGANTSDTFDDLIAFRTTLNTGNWTAQRVIDASNNSTYQTYLGYRNSNENVVIGSNTDPSSTAPLSPTQTMKKIGAGQVQVDCIGTNCSEKNIVQANQIQAPYLCSTKSMGDNTIRTDSLADACFRIKFLTRKNTNLGGLTAVNGMVVNNVKTVESPATLNQVRSGYTDEDSGMLEISKRTLDQAQSPQINAVSGTLPVDQCSPAGASGIDTNGRLICK